jgi:PAS domain S-box-containing protein
MLSARSRRPEPPPIQSYKENQIDFMNEMQLEMQAEIVGLKTELLSAQTLFRELLDDTPAVIYRLKLEGQKIIPHVVSEGINRLLGFTVAETRSYEWWLGQLHPEDSARAVGSVPETLAHGLSRTAYRIRHKDGDYRWVDDNRRLVRDSSGQPAELIGVWTDITERKHAEDEAQRSQSRLRDIIDGLGPSMFVGLMTPQGILIEANRSAMAAAGLKPEDVLGKPFEETYWWAYCPEIQQQLRDAIARAARGEASRYDVKIRAAKNHLIDVDFSLQLLRDETGAVVFLVPSGIVITERKRAETALRESEERMRLLVKSSNIGLWDWNLVTNEVFFSAEWKSQLGYADAELPSRFEEWESRLHPEDHEPTLTAVKDYLEGRRADYEVEFRLRHKDGSWRWLLTRANPTRDSTGHPVRIMGCHIDITERKRSEAALVKAHKELVEVSRQAGMAEVATGVLHNVGNVLNSVNVSTTLIAEQAKKSKVANLAKVVALMEEHAADLGGFITNDPKGKQLPGYLAQLASHLAAEQATLLKEMDQLRKNIEHITDIVAMQQSYAKVSGVTETLQVSDLVEDALRMNASALARHEVQVVREFGEVPPVTIDKHKVLQVLVNLIRNAKYACGDSGRLDKQMTVRVANGEGRLKIAIIDNGVGIPAENLIRIFNHGFTTRKDGHGFGLHSGSLAAKQLGGELRAQSDGVGHGATFTLELPLDRTEQAT